MTSQEYLETPPHTWRKSFGQFEAGIKLRNTSTYVEKISSFVPRITLKWKHLHIRGENVVAVTDEPQILETPPHTWRKYVQDFKEAQNLRNTSTYVEKIKYKGVKIRFFQKHLHIRGENLFEPLRDMGVEETPPHTWRKSCLFMKLTVFFRNTSTYVEKI